MFDFINNPRDLIEIYPETIELEPEEFSRAKQLSDRVQGEPRQWQLYLTHLAVLALAKWLKVRARGKPMNLEAPTSLQPDWAQLIDAATPLQVGDFRLCALVTESWLDDLISLPKAALELPEFAAHFYIAIAIEEEDATARLLGYWRRDRLWDYCKMQPPNSAWHYDLPLAGFDPQIDRLLYDCRYLDPQAFPLPAALPIPDWTRSQLTQFLRVLHSEEPEDWQQMSWERGQMALRYPELREVDLATLPPEALDSLAALLAHLHQPRLVRESARLSHWLKRSFEERWQQLESVLTPPALSVVRKSDRDFLPPIELPTRTTSETIATLLPLLQPDRPETTRCNAAGILGEIGAGYPEVVTALTELLHQGQSEKIRWEAALSLGKIAPDHPEGGVKRARLIDLGVQLNATRAVLIVAIVPKPDGRLGVWLEVQPSGADLVLPPGLKLGVLSPSGKVRLEAEARCDEFGKGKDNAISQHFSIGMGKEFQVRVSLQDATMTENFLT